MSSEPDFRLRAGLRRIYDDLAAEQAGGSPPCYQRGDCCDFSKVEHILFASTIEVQYLLQETPRKLLEPGLSHLSLGPAGPPPPTSRPSETAARIPCPYLKDRRCTVHETRPLGCRVYFCALAYRDRMGEVYERYNNRIRALADECGVEYRYAPFLAKRTVEERAV